MPGTGHSHRYKGSISNRVRKSPFQQLAEWNAQLLGADGSVPTITGGGGGLAFKKLDASDIEGVLHNPTKDTLHFTHPAGIKSDGTMKISAEKLTLGSTGGHIGFFGEGGTTQDSSGSINNFAELNTYLVKLGLLKN